MKKLIKYTLIVSSLFFFNNLTAQTDSTKSATIKVNGECGMCKKRIEKAAKSVEGVSMAVWDENTKLLNIKFTTDKEAAVALVQKQIASVGHDTEKFTATDSAYNKLPGCCQYNRKNN